MEEWADVSGYEGFYQVSNHGLVRSLDRVVMRSNGQPQTWKGRVLKPRKTKTGYCRVTLCDAGQLTDIYIHRLVLETFVGPVPDRYECNHRDGDKGNNCVDNLEWMTPSENHYHALKTGLNSNKGETHYKAKLSFEIAEMIRKIYALGQYSQRQIGIMFGVCQPVIGEVVRGETWTVV